MSELRFPFVTIQPGDIPRPYIPVTIANPDTGKKINVYALVDTGADECALPASFAQVLGHSLEAGTAKQISTGNGVTAAYGHTTIISVASQGRPSFQKSKVNRRLYEIINPTVISFPFLVFINQRRHTQKHPTML